MKTWTTIGFVFVVVTISALSSLPRSEAEEAQNIEQMSTAAKTPADHKAVANYYQTEGARLQREAEQHVTLAKTFRSEAGGQNPSASHHYERAEHCRKLAESLSNAAQEARALQKIHESLAQSAGGK
ncbi:MAG: hypothetical protein HOP18_12680 [Deltaproteobacteria bacterium]|nr:hypothetical protein [Deltaproteobacteria bacterium]